MPAADIGPALGQTAEAVATVPLLAGARPRRRGRNAPALGGLAGLIEGTVTASTWTAELTAPPAGKRFKRASAA